MTDDRFFATVGRWTCVVALAFVFICATLFVSVALDVMADPHPAFTIQPDSSSVTTNGVTRKVAPGSIR